MLVLGIETSGLNGSIALLRDQVCLGERHLNQVGRRHAQSLVMEIGNLLQDHGTSSVDIETVAVSRGPGSFTGLRVGMVCAKTFAYATGCRFIAVDTFAAIAENLPSHVCRAYVIENAQRDDLFVGKYHRNKCGDWVQTSQIQILSVSQFLRDRSDTDFVIGPGIQKLEDEVLPVDRTSEANVSQPKAAVIAELGRRLMLSDQSTASAFDTDFWKASPFYLRMSAAEEKRAVVLGKLQGSTDGG